VKSILWVPRVPEPLSLGPASDPVVIPDSPITPLRPRWSRQGQHPGFANPPVLIPNPHERRTRGHVGPEGLVLEEALREDQEPDDALAGGIHVDVEDLGPRGRTDPKRAEAWILVIRNTDKNNH